MLNKKVLALLSFASFFCFASCVTEDNSYISYTVNDEIKIDIPSSWKDRSKDEDSPYEALFVSQNNSVTTGVFIFYKGDSGQDFSSGEIFERQIDRIISAAKPNSVISGRKTRQLPGKTVTDTVYSGVFNVSKYCYAFSLVEFDGRDDIFAVCVQICKPALLDEYSSVLEKIADSVSLVENHQ